MDRAVNGIAGVNMTSLLQAAHGVLGIAGVDRGYKLDACLGVAGVDRSILSEAVTGATVPKDFDIRERSVCGVAGKFGTTLRKRQDSILDGCGDEEGAVDEDDLGLPVGPRRKGKKQPLLAVRAAREGFKKSVFLEDIWYLVKWDPVTKQIVWRKGFEAMFGRAFRKLPLLLDSGAFRRFMEQFRFQKWLAEGANPQEKPRFKPAWSNDYDCYLQAITLIDPDGYMAWDKMHDNVESYQGYRRMVADGFGEKLIPVYQIADAVERVKASGGRLREPLPYRVATSDMLFVAAVAQEIAADPIFQEYCSRYRTVAVGGMVQNPLLPVPARWVLFKELARLTRDLGTIIWGLGQACYGVVNRLGPEGLLKERISLDGTWWINHANTMQTITLVNGQLQNVNWVKFAQQYLGLSKEDVKDPDRFGIFNSRSEMMAMNIRALAGAFADCWKWPETGPTLQEIEDDPEAAYILGKHAKEAKVETLDLFNLAPDLQAELDSIPLPKPQERRTRTKNK